MHANKTFTPGVSSVIIVLLR